MDNNKILKVKDLQDLSIDTLINAYKNGYRIESTKYRDLSLSINKLATCPTSIVQGTSKTITITPSGGTPPYTLEFIVDNITKAGYTFTGLTGQKIFTYIFNESIGNHTYSTKITDSCIGGGKVITDVPCTINITAPSVIYTRTVSIKEGLGTVDIYVNGILKGTATPSSPVTTTLVIGDVYRRVAIPANGYNFIKYCAPADCTGTTYAGIDTSFTLDSTYGLTSESGYYFAPITCSDPSVVMNII